MDTRAIWHVLALIGALLLTGCRQDDSASSIALISDRVAKLEDESQKLKEQLSRVRFEASIAELDRTAFLRPEDDGYSTVRFDLGVLAVSMADVKPYANGSKVALKVGNLTSAKVNGLKAHVEWGRIDPNGLPMSESVKSREMTLGDELMPGSWRRAEVVLEGVPPSELGFLRLKEISHRGIGLRN